ncbi:MAG: sugar transferase [Sarcina sp.]
MQKIIKRTFDIVTALSGLIILLPIILIVAVLIRINLGSPILFKQKRIGKDNKEFEMMKFRTMKNTTGKDGRLLSDEERLTRFGKFIRSTSIDELPELINILKGNMSLIGPRPLLPEYLPLYSKRQLKRHDVLPGLTGWAQINGRNAISWAKKFDLDIYYVENWSLGLDIKIFFLTFKKLFVREGINKEGQATTEYFNGKN